MTRRWLALAAAILLVLVGGAAGLGYSASHANTVRADKATWTASSYEVGTPYAGVVQTVDVEPGSVVRKGAELFRVQSPTLQEAMRKIDFADGQVGYKILPNGTLVFTAAQAGVVRDTDVVAGEFVRADDRLASVAIDQTLRVEAEFTLTDRDYAKIPSPTLISVVMPGGRTVQAEVYYSRTLGRPSSHSVRTLMLARARDATLQSTVIDGAPAAARLDLVGEGPLAWVAEQVGRLFTPGGFAR